MVSQLHAKGFSAGNESKRSSQILHNVVGSLNNLHLVLVISKIFQNKFSSGNQSNCNRPFDDRSQNFMNRFLYCISNCLVNLLIVQVKLSAHLLEGIRFDMESDLRLISVQIRGVSLVIFTIFDVILSFVL